MAAIDPVSTTTQLGIGDNWLDRAGKSGFQPLENRDDKKGPDNVPTLRDAEDAIEVSKDIVSDMAAANDEDFVEALFEFPPDADTDAADDMVELMSVLSVMFDDSEAGFEMPEIMIVPNGDIEEATSGDLLPEGVLGAYVTADASDTEGGVIMLSDTLREDGNTGGILLEGTDRVLTLQDVATEELGEAVAVFAQEYIEDNELDLEVAEGDVGNRILKAAIEVDLTDIDFLDSDPNGTEESNRNEVLVLLAAQEVMAKASAASGWEISDADAALIEGIFRDLPFYP